MGSRHPLSKGYGNTQGGGEASVLPETCTTRYHRDGTWLLSTHRAFYENPSNHCPWGADTVESKNGLPGAGFRLCRTVSKVKKMDGIYGTVRAWYDKKTGIWFGGLRDAAGEEDGSTEKIGCGEGWQPWCSEHRKKFQDPKVVATNVQVTSQDFRESW